MLRYICRFVSETLLVAAIHGAHRNFYRIAPQNLGRPPDSQFLGHNLHSMENANWRYFLSEAWRPHEDKDFDNGSLFAFDMLGSG